MFLAWTINWVGLLLTGKIGKIVIYDKVVNGGTNHDSPGQIWVTKLVLYIIFDPHTYSYFVYNLWYPPVPDF